MILRQAILAAASVVTLALAAAAPADAGRALPDTSAAHHESRPAMQMMQMTHSAPAPARLTARQRDRVRAVRRATRPFHNLQRAMDHGYGLLTDAQGIACISMRDMGGEAGMGVHFADGDLVADPTERVRRPEALVYRLDAANRLRLAAVEYVVIASAWDSSHAAPPRLFGHRFGLTGAGNRYGLPPFYSLHAWVWHHNPAGMFAMYNPRVSCPGGAA